MVDRCGARTGQRVDAVILVSRDSNSVFRWIVYCKLVGSITAVALTTHGHAGLDPGRRHAVGYCTKGKGKDTHFLVFPDFQSMPALLVGAIKYTVPELWACDRRLAGCEPERVARITGDASLALRHDTNLPIESTLLPC